MWEFNTALVFAADVTPPAGSLVSSGSSDGTRVSDAGVNHHTPLIIQHRRPGLLQKSLLRFTARISHLLPPPFTGVLNYAASRSGVELQVDTEVRSRCVREIITTTGGQRGSLNDKRQLV